MLKSDYPELAKYWNYERNDKNGIHFEDVTHGSNKKVWWICDKGHEWESSPHQMSRGGKCPYCSSERILAGFNDLATTRKDLLTLWNYERNDKKPTDVMAGSNKKVWWKCPNGHEWEATPNNVSNGRRCPYCSSEKVLFGYNDLATKNPQLANEWDYEKNGNLKPQDFMPNSNKKVWWKCPEGHKWEAIIADRNRGGNCPFCSGKKVLPGFNDLATANPQLVREWNYKKNGNQKPEDYTTGSSTKVWWKCERGHEWKTSIANRTKGTCCPFCIDKKVGGRKVLPGYNDLSTINPQLASEWNYEKNVDSSPQDYMANSNKKVWWICKNGHEWEADISSRNSGRGCPICSRNMHISFPEKILFFYLRKTFPDAIENYKPVWLGKRELDIYIPSIKVGVEYDGVRYHRNEKRDMKKDRLCDEKGVTLIRIREKGLEYETPKSIVFTLQEDHKSNGKHLIPGLRFLEKQLGVDLDIDLSRDYDEIRSMVVNYNLDNCIARTNPELLDEWDYEKNGQVGNTPENVSAGAGVLIWWKCKNGHSYKCSLNNKTSNHTGCPYCNSHKVLQGYNDLATKNPQLASEWNYERNVDLKPQDFMAGSGKKVWWRCKNGHEWEASILSRNRGNGCPQCAKEKRIKH